MISRPLAFALVIALAAPALADTISPRVRQKEERLRKAAEEKRAAAMKPPFEFVAPEGFTVTEPEGEAAPAFAATSVKPPATMSVTVEKGPVVLDDAFLADNLKKVTDTFVAAHPDGTVKLVKNQRVKLDAGEAVRLVVDTRVDKKKSTKPQRELHYIVSNSTHHAHFVYATAAAGFAKLDKKFDASLRATKGINSPSAAAATP